MGWRFRKSFGNKFFRVNLSKKGIGFSVGVPGARVGVNASGKKYTSVGIPGTGIYRVDYEKKQPASASTGFKLTGKSFFVLLAIALLIAYFLS